MDDTVKAKRTPDDVWADIEKFLGTTDGIATADAFRLGKLVKEYGERCGSEAARDIIDPLLKSMQKSFDKPKEPREPWQDGL